MEDKRVTNCTTKKKLNNKLDSFKHNIYYLWDITLLCMTFLTFLEDQQYLILWS